MANGALRLLNAGNLVYSPCECSGVSMMAKGPMIPLADLLRVND